MAGERAPERAPDPSTHQSIDRTTWEGNVEEIRRLRAELAQVKAHEVSLLADVMRQDRELATLRQALADALTSLATLREEDQ